MNINRNTYRHSIFGAAMAIAVALAPMTADAATSSAPTEGWVAATLAPGYDAGPVRLVLVSPSGAHRQVTRLTAGSRVVDMSGDGTRVLVVDGANTHWRVVDTRTGRSTAVRGTWFSLSFTRPKGLALLGRATADGALQRLDLGGRPAVTFPGTSGSIQPFVAMNPTGTVVVTGSAHSRLQVSGNATGRLLRTLPDPAGYTYCSVGHWLDATHFTGACQPKDLRRMDSQTFSFAVDGSRPVPMTNRLPLKGRSMFGYVDSWPTAARPVVELAATCGPPTLGVVKAGAVNVIPGLDEASPVGVVGSGAYYTGPVQCDGGFAALSRYDLVTGTSRVLAGGTVDRGLAVTSTVLLAPKQ